MQQDDLCIQEKERMVMLEDSLEGVFRQFIAPSHSFPTWIDKQEYHRKEKNYGKHSTWCREIVDHLVDIAANDEQLRRASFIEGNYELNSNLQSDDELFHGMRTNMLVIIRQGLITGAAVYLLSHVHLKYWLGIWTAVVYALAVIGSVSGTLQWLPGKDPSTGRLRVVQVLVFFPYYIGILLLMVGGRVISYMKRWSSYTEILDGIYIGDYYSSFSSGIKWGGIVDITNELPRLGGASVEYLNIPSWDGCPPSAVSIQAAVSFVSKCKKPVLIHCAHGKGRSATVACACLMMKDKDRFGSIEKVVNFVKRLRPQTSVNGRMKKALEIWQRTYLGKQK